ncbi:hypothetical protein [Myroides sp.]|uniref:hypothetical protein n=1 Tax=Myroides sp. TaxID=1874736 RepID=UPI0028A71264|nr:hypothetical protein [Myroides sp.]
MVKDILVLVLLLVVFSSCNRKVEVIRSNVMPHLFLLKNTNEDNIEETKEIVKSIIDTIPKKDTLVISFYKYTSGFGPFSGGTAHFIDNREDPGGFSSEMLMDYNEVALIAEYWIWPKDGKKRVSRELCH